MCRANDPRSLTVTAAHLRAAQAYMLISMPTAGDAGEVTSGHPDNGADPIPAEEVFNESAEMGTTTCVAGATAAMG